MFELLLVINHMVNMFDLKSFQDGHRLDVWRVT